MKYVIAPIVTGTFYETASGEPWHCTKSGFGVFLVTGTREAVIAIQRHHTTVEQATVTLQTLNNAGGDH